MASAATSWVDRIMDSEMTSQSRKIPLHERICYNCGEKGHEKVNCVNARKVQCFNCSEFGHVRRTCSKPVSEQSQNTNYLRSSVTLRQASNLIQEPRVGSDRLVIHAILEVDQ